MNITYELDKSNRNIAEYGLSFERVADFNFTTAKYAVDERAEPGENRVVAVGYLADGLHVVCFLEEEEGIRVLGFRPASTREIRHYEAN